MQMLSQQEEEAHGKLLKNVLNFKNRLELCHLEFQRVDYWSVSQMN